MLLRVLEVSGSLSLSLLVYVMEGNAVLQDTAAYRAENRGPILSDNGELDKSRHGQCVA